MYHDKHVDHEKQLELIMLYDDKTNGTICFTIKNATDVLSREKISLRVGKEPTLPGSRNFSQGPTEGWIPPEVYADWKILVL